MPLSQFVSRLRRVAAGEASSSSVDSIHPLHNAIDAVLLTSRWCTYKHHDLLQKEHTASSAPDESAMMSWALNKAIASADADDDLLSIDPSVRRLEAEQREYVPPLYLWKI